MAAARRLSKSSVDWAKFSSLVPEKYTNDFRHLKLANDKFVGRVNSLPAQAKPIDFAKYKAAGVSAEIVDRFANQYKALEVPYPKDLANQKGRVDKEEVTAIEASRAFIALLQEQIKLAGDYVETSEKVPQLGEITKEMYMDYFPEQVISNQNCIEAEGYLRDPDAHGSDRTLYPPWQIDFKYYRFRIVDWFQWQFLLGPYARHFERQNSDLYPEDPTLEEERIYWLRKDAIIDIGSEKIELLEFPSWANDADIAERGFKTDAQLIAEGEVPEKLVDARTVMWEEDQKSISK